MNVSSPTGDHLEDDEDMASERPSTASSDGQHRLSDECGDNPSSSPLPPRISSTVVTATGTASGGHGPPARNRLGTVVLHDIPIVSLFMDGKERLCLAQISTTLLRHYSCESSWLDGFLSTSWPSSWTISLFAILRKSLTMFSFYLYCTTLYIALHCTTLLYIAQSHYIALH